MSLSSSSGSRRLQIIGGRRIVAPVPPPPCLCPTYPPSKQRVSWIGVHPARRCMNYALSLVNPMACKYFDWIDPKLGEEYDYYKKLLIEMKSKLEARKDYVQIEKLEKKVNKPESKHATDKAQIQKITVELKMITEQAEKCKKKNLWTWVAILAGVGVLVAWFVMV